MFLFFWVNPDDSDDPHDVLGGSVEIMAYFRDIIPFYDRTIQVSESGWWFGT